MAHAYATVNKLAGLAAGAFDWSAGLEDSTRTRLNDGRMSSRYVNGNAASGINLIIDLGSAMQLSGFAALNSNCAVQKTDATLKVESADDAAMSVNLATNKAASTLYSSAAPRNKDHVLQFALSTARRYWRLTWTWTGTVTNFSIGELFAFASQTQLSRVYVYGGGGEEEVKTAQIDFDTGGQGAYFLGGPVRSLRMPFEDLTESERDELLAMWRATKDAATPILFIPSYEATSTAAAVAQQECVYGRLQLPQFAWTEHDFQLFTSPEIVVRSLGREVGS